jgi:hypothetical protein
VNDKGALVDRGANGTVCGDDVSFLDTTPKCYVNTRGLGGHEIKEIPLGTAAGDVTTQHGPVIAIMHQVAYLGKGKSIISPVQLEHFKINVFDKSIKAGGKQCMKTPDGYIHPLDMINGLAYTPMRPVKDDKWDELPQVIWTSDEEWNPSIFDHILSNDEDWFSTICDDHNLITQENDNPFDFSGQYKHRYKVQSAEQIINTVAFDDSTLYFSEPDDISDKVSFTKHVHFDLPDDVSVTSNDTSIPHLSKQPEIDDDSTLSDNYANIDIDDESIESEAESIESGSSLDNLLYDIYHHQQALAYGEYLIHESDYTNSIDEYFQVYNSEFYAEPIDLRKKEPNYEKLRPYFMNLPKKVVQKTMETCTMLARMPVSSYLKHRYKSQFPALNVWRRPEAVATDTVYSDTPAIDGGEKSAQLFIGSNSLYADAYGMKTDKQFVNTLEDNII